jgi:hypothetical protein
MAGISTTGNSRIDTATAEIALALRAGHRGHGDQYYYDWAMRLRDEILAGAIEMAAAGVYNPVTGEHWDQAAAERAWGESMERSRSGAGPARWQLHGDPGAWKWVFFNFGPWTGEVQIEADGFHWHTRSYDTGHIRHKGVTCSLYEAYQSVEQNRPVSHTEISG